MLLSKSGWRIVRAVAGAGLAVAALYASLIHVDWPAFLGALRGARMFWIGAAAASVLLTLSLVTIRWARLLGVAVAAFAPSLWASVVIGQAVNIVFPLRFGEGARVAVTCRETGLPLGRVMVAMAVERALDVAAFGAVVSLLILGGRLPGAFAGVLPMSLALMLATIGAVILMARALPAAMAWLRPRVSHSSVMDWLDRQAAGIRSGWHDMSQGTRRWVLLLLTAFGLLSSASANWLVFRAFALPVPPIAALVLLAVLQVGTAVVSVPGNIGVFQYLTIATLAAWQVPPPTALAVAVVLHVVTLGPRVVFGAVAAASSRARADLKAGPSTL